MPGMEYQVSYQARLPKPGTVRVVHQDGNDLIEGVWGGRRRELFDGFWTETVTERAEDPYHVQYVQCRPDPLSIADLTERWGPVGSNDVRLPNPDPHALGFIRDPNRFQISVRVWIDYQTKVKEIWNLIARPASRRDLRRAEQFHPLFHFGPGEGDWTGLKLSLDPVRENGRRYLRPTLRPTSQWVALLVMLWLDVSTRKATFGICENPKCRKEFRSDRPNRKFCSFECAHRHHNLLTYHRAVKKHR